MSLKTIRLLNKEITLPFRFNLELPFSDYDKNVMPWLKNDTRYYGIDEGGFKKGGRAIALIGFVSDEHGNSLPTSKKIVLKVPNLDTDKFTAEEVKEYLHRQCEECEKEWKLTRAQLKECKYANPIFDFRTYLDEYLDEIVHLPVSVQFFLGEASSLDDYLVKTGQRAKPYMSEKGKTIDNWNGINDPSKWIELAQCLAVGLTDIHERRVVHGDIWPPNVFIKTDDIKPYPVFIDFGDAFPIGSKGGPKNQRAHAYLAPERQDGQSIVTQQADVYSYGMLLLHLAIGEEPILSKHDRDYKRRQIIKEKFEKRNRELAIDNPFIIDIICKCVSLDPVDRPGMNDILMALNSYIDPKSYSSHIPKVSDRLASLKETWNEIMVDLATKGATVGPFLEELVEQRIYDIEETIRSLSKDVIILNDTRERLILAMISLFRRLDKGDRFISITSPLMWRSSALGMDGRYFSATELAAVRGASIQRVFIFSIQEVGEDWASDLAGRLEELHEKQGNLRAAELADSLRSEINTYNALSKEKDRDKKVPTLHEELQVDARKQLIQITKSHLDISKGICKGLFDKTDKFDSEKCEGIFLGFKPVSTLSAYRTLKSAFSSSIFFYSKAEPHDQYLLMRTDCLSRNSYGNSVESALNNLSFHRYQPELRGITVFKSALGVPNDRIKAMGSIFKQSINIGGWIESFYEVLDPEHKYI